MTKKIRANKTATTSDSRTAPAMTQVPPQSEVIAVGGEGAGVQSANQDSTSQHNDVSYDAGAAESEAGVAVPGTGQSAEAAAIPDAGAAQASEQPIIPGRKLTHSYRLFALLKKQKGIATTDELAAATGLKPFYVSWYMAELKRVYGLDYEHKRGEAEYRALGIEDSGIVVPPHGVAGLRRGNPAPESALDVGKPSIAKAGVASQVNADVLLMDAITRAQKAIQQEFDRLRVSLSKVKIQNKKDEVRVAAIPWDAWLQMKKELEQSRKRA